MIVVILGMHKSGTTLVASLLHHAGIKMIESDAVGDYDSGQYYERDAALRLNLDILGVDARAMLSVPPPARLALSADQRARMRQIIASCAARHADWGLKDPRACLTYPLWAQELPAHHIIAVYRPVTEIWPRYREHSLRRAVALVTRWCEYNQRILDYARQTDMLLLSYRHLVTTDAALRRLADFVGRPLIDTRRPDLYRSRDRTSVMMAAAQIIVRLTTSHRYRRILDQLEAYDQ